MYYKNDVSFSLYLHTTVVNKNIRINGIKVQYKP